MDMNKKIVSEYKMSNMPTDLIESESYVMENTGETNKPKVKKIIT